MTKYTKTYEVILADVSSDNNLSGLLTSLTNDVVKLKEQAAARFKKGAEWFAVDIKVVSDYYEVLVSQRRKNGLYATTRFGETSTHLHAALPELYAALQDDLLTVSALLDALNHADTVDAIRDELSKGTRTHKAKSRGFRWDISPRFSEHFEAYELHKDVSEFGSTHFEYFGVPDTVQLSADYETLRVSAKSTAPLVIPFDHYPFLARAVVQATNDYELEELREYVANDLKRVSEVLEDIERWEKETKQWKDEGVEDTK